MSYFVGCLHMLTVLGLWQRMHIKVLPVYKVVAIHFEYIFYSLNEFTLTETFRSFTNYICILVCKNICKLFNTETYFLRISVGTR